MRAIIKREIKNYLKNPVFLIGAVIVFVQLYLIFAPFLKLHYWNSEEELQNAKVEDQEGVPEYYITGDITEGFIKSSYDEKVDRALNLVRDDLVNHMGLSEKEADALLKEAREYGSTELEIGLYIEEKCGYLANNFLSLCQVSEYRKATVDEVNTYMEESFEEESYTSKFSKKYADFMGLLLIAFSMILMAFLFIQDTRKNTYELLHTKPISAESYILGKVLGGFAALMIPLVLFTTIFDVWAVLNGIKQGFPVSFLDMWKAALIYILPNLLMLISVYAGVAILFKNPLPATPLLLLYMVYSNMGGRNAEGRYGFYGRPLAILVRFPHNFMELEAAPYAELNQLFLLLASIGIILLTIFIWKRRRVY